MQTIILILFSLLVYMAYLLGKKEGKKNKNK